MKEKADTLGRIVRIAGPVVGVVGLQNARLHDVVYVGELRLVGEVIRLAGEVATIQVYEETSGVRLGEPVSTAGGPLSVRLGPGLLGQVYDGLQRPLTLLAEQAGAFMPRGVLAPPLDTERKWSFSPALLAGETVVTGDILGSVPESAHLDHRILVPPGVRGRLIEIGQGEFSVQEPIAAIESAGGIRSITMAHSWPVRHPRPVRERRSPKEVLVTGTRVIDAFFPLARGGAAIIPGGFGTGKTVLQHALSRWAEVDVVVYVGCGERGNEMAEVLEDFPRLEDLRTGLPLMDRTVLIANTSNMPVAAREASIYTGMTIAEYYRDMGYDVLLLADSTSRWGEALREISGRLEEMPGEEGYPAYLGTRIAEFYERAGRVTPLGAAGGPRSGSVTVVGAVSPPGGDFSEPMTQSSMRAAGTFWALDYDLSRRRHFPAINWIQSYTLYKFDGTTPDSPEAWEALTKEAMIVLRRESELLEIVQLVGPDALSEAERAVLFTARMIREDFLQQSAFHPVDRFCSLEKARWMLRTILEIHRLIQRAVEADIPLERLAARPIMAEVARMKERSVEEVRALAGRVPENMEGVRV